MPERNRLRVSIGYGYNSSSQPDNEHRTMNDFSKATLRKLAKRGITLTGITALPDADGTYFNPTRGYLINDNGTGRVMVFAEVLALAA